MKNYSKLSVAMLLCFLSACSDNSPEKRLADAELMLEKGQLQEASVTLKNVIKDDPSLLKAREMLGLTYLQQGLYLAAQKELLRAQSVLSDESKVALAETHLWLEEYESIKDLSIENEGQTKDKLEIYQAIALFRAQSPTSAISVFEKLETSPFEDIASLAKAYNATIREKPAAALKVLVDNAAQIEDSPLALQLKFTLENFVNDWSSAIDTSKKLLSLRPADYKVKTQLATVLINAGEFEEAKPVVEQLLRLSPEQAYFNQLKGTLLVSEKDYEGAILYLDKAIKNGRSNQITRLFSAISHYQLGNFEQAYQNLSVIIDTLPKDHYAKRLYTSIQLKLGYVQDGIDTINTMSDLGQDDLLYIVETSRLLVQKNELDEAKRLIGKIESDQISDSKMLQNIGLLKLITGKEGLSELERNLDISPESENSFYLLLVAYVENKAYDKAYELIDSRLTGEENKIERLNATGFVQQTAGDIESAQQTYQKLKDIDPKNLEAALFFIEQSIKNGELEKAAQQLSSAIDNYPLSTRLLIRSFQVAQRLGNIKPAIKQLKEAQGKSKEPKYALLYAAALSLDNQFKTVVDYLSENQQKLKDTPKYWMLLGNAYAKQSNYKEARKAFTEWRKLEPSQNSFVQSIQIEEIERDYLKAEQVIEEARRKLGKNTTIELLAARLKLLQGKNKDASKAYNALPDEAKKSLIGQVVKGRLAITEGNYQSAISTLEPLYEDAPSSELALLLLTSYVQLEQHEQILSFAKAHLERAQSDNKVRLLFANYLLEREPRLAIEQYTYLVDNVKKESPLVLNNLAWLLNQNGSPSKALKLIERANELVPNNPNILSTYGAVLSSLSKHEAAIEKAKEAFVISKENVSIGIEYVRALARGGRKIDAQRVASTIIPVTAAQETQLNQVKQQFQL